MKKIYQETRSLNNAKDFNIKINNKPPYSMHPSDSLHWHSYYEVLFIYDDNTNLRILNNEYPLKKGSILFLSPYVIHDTINLNQHFNKELVCHFSEKFLESMHLDPEILHLLTHQAILHKPFAYNINNPKALDSLQKLYDIYPKAHKNRSSTMLFQGYMIIFIASLVEEISSTINTLNSSSTALSIIPIQNYLHEKIKQQVPISLRDIATFFGYEATYFSKLFMSSFGFTFKDYVSSLKIQQAQKLLQCKENSIAKIAEILNYSSPQNFCRAYKAITGISPYQYKKLIREYTHL